MLVPPTLRIALVLLVCLAKHSSSWAALPNIVLIVADDLGYGDVECYGSTYHHTPHIDALAAHGLRFTDFHSAGPMCSATRAAMLTGRYQQRYGSKFDRALSETEHADTGLPLEAITLAELLQGQGYATACFGKWHLGYHPPWLPTSQGFDLFRGLTSGDGDHHTHITRRGNQDWWHNDTIEMEAGYTADLLTRYSVEFIESHREHPFFLYVPHLAIHFPWQGPQDPPHRVVGKNYDDDKWGIIPDRHNIRPHVAAMVESLDNSVGAIVAALKQHQLERNTIVVFTSDNGGYITYGDSFRNISSNGPLRGQKTELYEGGHRVPTIVSWPGRIDPAVTAELGHSTDLLPTLAGLANVTVESTATDGIDLAPLWLQREPLPNRILYWRSGSQRAVRKGDWKLVINQSKPELYNLHEDIGEQRDVANLHPTLVAELTQAWQAWEADVNHSALAYEGSSR